MIIAMVLRRVESISSKHHKSFREFYCAVSEKDIITNEIILSLHIQFSIFIGSNYVSKLCIAYIEVKLFLSCYYLTSMLLASS